MGRVWTSPASNSRIELSEQMYSYHQRLEQFDTENSQAFVRHAFAEQRSLNLVWFSNLARLRSDLRSRSNQKVLSPKQTKETAQSVFEGVWDRERKQNKKLSFYNTVKDSFNIENYLSVDLKHKNLKRIAQLRTSSHRFSIETGRNGAVKQREIRNRLCNHCCDMTNMDFLAELPFFDPIVEDEIHVLQSCPL